MEIISKSLDENVAYIKNELNADNNFDVVYRVINIGSKRGAICFIDGFCKDELMQKMLQYLMDLKEEKEADNAYDLIKTSMPYVEVDLKDKWDDIIYFILSGVFAIFIEGYDRCILIDSRTYPARSVSEPDKDKAQRGSKDGFVETIVFNTALIRRRIRDRDLCMEIKSVGRSGRTDVVLCYMGNRVDKRFLNDLRERIDKIDVDALTMNQQSLAEKLYKGKWLNPFPKFRYTERPDTAAAQVLEGNIIVLVDNSPQAMILPIAIWDLMEEADDYYFPPITGTYLRLSRYLIGIFNYLLTPLFLLLMQNPTWIPENFKFIMLKETANVPLIWQFLILEVAIDGLRLAAVNTPNMLSTPLSVMAALVLGEFAVNSGWFSAEVMLYMAFVAIANYTQANYELGYAIKFMRILTLILTAIFDVFGFAGGIIITILFLVVNKTIDGKSYIKPVIPYNRKIKRLFTRNKL